MKQDWIVAYGGSHEDGVTVFRQTRQTAEEMKAMLVEACKELRKDYEDNGDFSYSGEYAGNYEFGSETVEDIEVRPDGCLYAYVCFERLHVDIEAVPTAVLKKWR